MHHGGSDFFGGGSHHHHHHHHHGSGFGNFMDVTAGTIAVSALLLEGSQNASTAFQVAARANLTGKKRRFVQGEARAQ